MTSSTWAICALAVLLAACGSPTPAVTNAQAQPVPEAPAPAPSPIGIGKPGQAGGVAFTVTDVTTPKQIGYVDVGPKAEAGETFVVIAYTLKNISSRPLAPSGRPSLTLIDPNGQSYAPDETASGLAALHMEGTGGFSSDLNPNVSAKNGAAWKLDASAFDLGTWRLAVATDPQLTFALK